MPQTLEVRALIGARRIAGGQTQIITKVRPRHIHSETHWELMTLGNMRANGERTLAAWCLGRGCNHFRVLDVSGNSDHMPVPSIRRATHWPYRLSYKRRSVS